MKNAQRKRTTMPNVTIKFKLPEEQSDYNLHHKAPKYASVVYEFTNFLRSKVKYTEEKGSWEEAYEEWWKHLKDEDIDPYGE